MKLAVYCDYGYYLTTQQALKKLEEHGIEEVACWLSQDPYYQASSDEHELFATVKDCGLSASQAYLPAVALPYLANSRYGHKEAVKAYKQYVLAASEYGVNTLIMDALAPTAPFVEAMQEICDYAKEQGVMVCVRDAQGVDMIGLLSRLDDLYYCLDTAVCIKEGIDVQERASVLKDRLMTVILSDLALDDTRVLPGYGKTDFAPIMAAIKSAGYQGLVTVQAQKAGALDADAFLEAAKKLV